MGAWNLLELLRKQAAGGDLDFLRGAVAVLAEAVMEAEVAAQIGAGHGERSTERTTWRNGYRPRRWDTRAGSIELQIPKLRQGSYFPALLDTPGRRPRALARLRGHLQEPGLEDLRRARHRRHELPRAAARRRSVPLPLARRAHPAGARGGPHRPGQPCGVSPRTRVGWSPPPSTPTASARCWALTSAERGRRVLAGVFSAGWWRAGSPASSS